MKLPRKRELVALLLYYSGLVHAVGLVRRWAGVGGPVFLMGHRVFARVGSLDAIDEMALRSGHAITAWQLEERLAFVRRWLLPAGDPAELAAGLPVRRAFYLTFDDGYRDNVSSAAPVLDRLGVRAVIFLVAKLIAHPKAAPWWDSWGGEAIEAADSKDTAVRTYEGRCKLAKESFTGLTATDLQASATQRYLSAKEVADLPPTFYVANHTASHAILTLLDAVAVDQELIEGEQALATHPRLLPIFAYPCGCLDSRVVERVRQTGRYKVAFATGNGVDGDSWRQKRVNLNVASFPLFAAQCAGLMS